MRNYEIVFLVHPDQSDQTSSILSKLDKITKDSEEKYIVLKILEIESLLIQYKISSKLVMVF